MTYLIIILWLVVLITLRNKRNYLIVSFAASLVVGLTYAMRSLDTGNDVMNYFHHYSKRNLNSSFVSERFFEPLFDLLLVYSPSFQFFLGLCAFLTIFFILIIDHEKLTTGVSIVILLSLSGFLNNMTDQIRQYLAFSVFLFLFYKWRRSLLLSSLATMLVHYSAIVLLLIWPWKKVLSNRRIKAIIFMLTLALLVINVKFLFLPKMIINLLFFIDSDTVYIQERFFESLNQDIGLMYYFRLSILMFLIITSISNDIIGSEVLILGLFLQLFSLGLMPLERIGDLFYFVGIIEFVRSGNTLSNLRVVPLYSALAVQFAVMMIFDLEKHGSIPWQFIF